MTSDNQITELLRNWQHGERDALDTLMPLVHEQLRRLAASQMRNESSHNTLQATALVNEAYLRLAKSDVSLNNRAHFFAMAARMMRRILVDHARARNSARRGAGAVHVTLVTEHADDDPATDPVSQVEILSLDHAIDSLAAHDERKADILILTYFGGMSCREIGAVLNIAPITVSRDLRFARAWIGHHLNHHDRPRG